MTAQTEHRLKILLWAIPVVWGFGGFYALMVSTSASLEGDVAAIQTDLREHESLKAHPVGAEKMETILVEQRDIRAEQKVQGQNLAAICSATGARCR